MKKSRMVLSICFSLILFSFSTAYALPNLQVYIPGSTAGSAGADQETWVYSGGGPITLNVVISFGPKDVSVSHVTLLVSVKQDQTGSITGLPLPGTTHTDTSFLPPGIDSNHYPLNKPDTFDYITFDLDLGEIQKPADKGDVPNYNAEDGTITTQSGYAVQTTFSLDISGYDYAHLDVYADYNNSDNGWEITPGTHDSAVVPEPATIFLMGSGLLGAGIFLRRKLLKPKAK